MAEPLPQIADIAHTIQQAVTPVFLLAGIGGIMNVVASRLGRVVDRSRQLEREFTDPDHPLHGDQVWELRILDRRMQLANLAILLCTASAVMVCLVVGGLFVAQLAELGFARTMAVGFVVAMLLLVSGLLLFLLEIRVALQSVRVHERLLERTMRGAVSAAIERRLLQIVVAVACFVPLSSGGLGILRGPSFVARGFVAPVNLDSHFRYMSGIFFALGLAYVSCIPAVERKGPRFRLLSAMVVSGGLARLLSLVMVGTPGFGHRFGLVMELLVVPLLALWQARVARRFRIQ